MSDAVLRVMERMERARSLDGAVRALGSVASGLVGGGSRAALLEGRWLGHTFHALLTDFVEGPWMAASFLDLFGPPGSAAAARRLLGFGLVVSPVAQLSGLADWRQPAAPGSRRVGVVHALGASTATALYAASYVARCRERQKEGTILGLVGGLVALLDGYVAGHLSHVRGVAVGELT